MFYYYRVKSIKNKARVNVELSSAELKTLLKKAKNEAVSFQQYISALESEIGVLRSVSTPPKEKCASIYEATSAPAQPPTPPEPYDERKEFLKRENEPTDQIAEKESVSAAQEKIINEVKEDKLQEDINTKVCVHVCACEK